MNRIRTLGALLLIPALMLAAAGCGDGGGKSQPRVKRSRGGGGDDDNGGGAAVALKEVEAKGRGTLSGKAVFDGTPPTPAFIKAMETHTDSRTCLAGTLAEKVDQRWFVSEKGGVANVVVFLQPAERGYFFPLTKEQAAITNKSAVIDQPHCAFVPHVLAFWSNYYDPKTNGYRPTGIQLQVDNSAPIGHNTRLDGGKLGDFTIPSKTNKRLQLDFRTTSPVKLECSMHPWMNAFVWPLDNPYFAVSKEDGTFEIKDIPTGVQARVFVWHEAVGFLPEFGKDEGKVIDLTEKTSLGEIKLK